MNSLFDGDLLRRKRMAHGWTIEAFADYVGYSRHDVSKHEQGITQPRWRVAKDYATALGCRAEEFFPSLVIRDAEPRACKTPQKRFDGNALRRLRIKKHFRTRQLAQFAGLTYAFVNGCERGRYRPDADMLRDLANALECDINDLLKGE